MLKTCSTVHKGRTTQPSNSAIFPCASACVKRSMGAKLRPCTHVSANLSSASNKANLMHFIRTIFDYQGAPPVKEAIEHLDGYPSFMYFMSSRVAFDSRPGWVE